MDSGGRERIGLSVGRYGANLSLYDTQGRTAISLSVNPDGTPLMGVYDARRSGDARLSAAIQMSVTPGTDATLSFADATTGLTRISLGVESDGSPTLRLWDKAGNGRMLLRVRTNGIPSVMLHDAAGQVLFNAP